MASQILSTIEVVQFHWIKIEDQMETSLNSLIKMASFCFYNEDVSSRAKNKIKIVAYFLFNNLVWRNDLEFPYPNVLRGVCLIFTVRPLLRNMQKEYRTSTRRELQIQLASVVSNVGLAYSFLHAKPFRDTFMKSLANGNLGFPVITAAGVMVMPYAVNRATDAYIQRSASRARVTIQEVHEESATEGLIGKIKTVFNGIPSPTNWKVPVFLSNARDSLRAKFSTQAKIEDLDALARAGCAVANEQIRQASERNARFDQFVKDHQDLFDQFQSSLDPYIVKDEFHEREPDSTNPISMQAFLQKKLLHLNFTWDERIAFVKRHPDLQRLFEEKIKDSTQSSCSLLRAETPRRLQ